MPPTLWRTGIVVGETTRSWLVGTDGDWWIADRDPQQITRYATKVPKSGTRFTTKEEADQQAWAISNRYRISQMVGSCYDGATLRKIAELVGYDLGGE